MVKHFEFGEPTYAAFWAGILIGAFSFFEALSSYYWGALSDRIGRKPVILFGCTGTIFSLLFIGFAPNFWVALFGRALGGCLNGNLGVIQTMVSEIVKKPEHEPKAYSVSPFAWSVGTMVGPVIGAYFSDPAEYFPSYFPLNGLFGCFPYLLPNLICATLLSFSIVTGFFLLQESHPRLQPKTRQYSCKPQTDSTPLVAGARDSAETDVNLQGGHRYGTFDGADGYQEEQAYSPASRGSPLPSICEKLRPSPFTTQVSMLIIAMGIFCYHAMTYDHLLPIFLQQTKTGEISGLATPSLTVASSSSTTTSLFHMPGGLGLSRHRTGMVLFTDGFIALFIQGIVFPLVVSWLGVWATFFVVTILQPIAYFIVPFTNLLPEAWVYPGLFTCLIIRNLLSIIAYPIILILLKQASPDPLTMGRINGVAAAVGAACRTVAPPFAGMLYGIGTAYEFTGLAWWGSALVGVFGALQLYYVRREKVTGPPTADCLAQGFPIVEVSAPDPREEEADQTDWLLSGFIVSPRVSEPR
jgi:MFS family permease